MCFILRRRLNTELIHEIGYWNGYVFFPTIVTVSSFTHHEQELFFGTGSRPNTLALLNGNKSVPITMQY